MSRKDYELIAEAISITRDNIRHNQMPARQSASLYGADETSRTLADSIALKNPRFNRQRFLAACGISQE